MDTSQKNQTEVKVTVKHATQPEELDVVRGFMRDFVEWVFERHHEYLAFVQRYFNPEDFEVELRNLPGSFAPPKGALMLASIDGNQAGCVGLRDLGDGVCEMKRLYVNPNFHGNGVGEALVEALISQARILGISKMRLDTGPNQFEARGLYTKMGFKPISSYYEVNEEMKDWLIFMELDLKL